MKILDAAIQIALLLIAFWSVGQITLSIFAFVDLDLPTEANPFVFLAKGVLFLFTSIDVLAGTAICWVSLLFWSRRQRRLIADIQASGEAAAGTVLGAFLKQAGSLVAIAVVVVVTPLVVDSFHRYQGERTQREAEQRQFREEHPEGPFTKFYANGQKMIEGRYDGSGLIQGPVTGWYESGQKQFERTIIDGRFRWTELGVPEDHNHIYGWSDGPSVSWYENGQMASEEFFFDRRLDGLSRSWWPDGQLKSEKVYSRDGTATWKYWHANGQLEFEIGFINAHIDGVLTPLSRFGTKENGLGQWSERSEDGGTTVSMATRAPGQPSGTWTRWYDNGQMREQETWVQGKLHGTRTYWLEDGQKFHEEVFVEGRRIKDTYFSKDGEKRQ